MKFADPKNDLAFKKIFGNKDKQNILISFLNAILDFKGDKIITEVSMANPYQVPKIPDLKETILDIKAINQAGEHFIVEMQKKDLNDFAKRSLYYTSKAYVEQLDQGNHYASLNKVYFIGIVNFNLFDSAHYVSRHLILHSHTHTQDIADFEFAFLELPKFTKDLNQLETILDKWIYFLKNAANLNIIPAQYENITELRQAFEVATQQTWSKKEIYEYV